MFNFFKNKPTPIPQNITKVVTNSNTMIGDPPYSLTITEDFNKNMSDFNNFIGKSYDIKTRYLKLSVDEGIDASIVFLDGLVDKDFINKDIINPLLSDLSEKELPKDLINHISKKIIRNLQVEESNSWTTILEKLYSGDTILLIDKCNSALIFETKKWTDRGVQESTTEQVITGPKDCFSETLLTNSMLIRRRLRTHNLQMETMKIGTLTKTDIIVSYIDGVVNPKLINELRTRLNRIEVDSIIGSTKVEELIEDNSFALFPQISHTERPDRATSHLLEGGALVLVDGTPRILMLPTIFWNFLTTSEDYYERIYTSLASRALRLISIIISLTLPSFYIAISSFHQEMIPISLLQVIINGRHGVPFPLLIEVIIMEFILEIIREAGARLPRNVGQAISIVGALVLGQAAIQSKLASPATVTIVAITAVANFSIPLFSAAFTIRILRFILLIVSGMYGIFGFIVTLFVILAHLCSLRSFGVPFFAPLAPLVPGDLKDTLIRAPFWSMNRRSQIYGAVNSVRQKPGIKPGINQED